MNKKSLQSGSGPIGWMAGNSVAANLLMLILLIAGIISGIQARQELFPEVEVQSVYVTVPYPGASPDDP